MAFLNLVIQGRGATPLQLPVEVIAGVPLTLMGLRNIWLLPMAARRCRADGLLRVGGLVPRCVEMRNTMGADAPVAQGARREHSSAMYLTKQRSDAGCVGGRLYRFSAQ